MLKRVRYWLQQKLSWIFPLPKNLNSHLLGWHKEDNYNIYGKLWNISPTILMWKICKESNKRVFSNIGLSIPSFLNKVEANILCMKKHKKKQNVVQRTPTNRNKITRVPEFQFWLFWRSGVA